MLVNFLATVNRDEVAAGRLAAIEATRADVKAFANRMVTEHSSALAKLSDGAKAGGWMSATALRFGGMVGSSDMTRMKGKGDSSRMRRGDNGTGMAVTRPRCMLAKCCGYVEVGRTRSGSSFDTL